MASAWSLRPSWGWAAIPALLACWSLSASRVPAYVLPQPWAVAAEAWRWIRTGELWPQVWASFLREAGGFVIAAVVAAAIGFAGGLSRAVRDFTRPLVALFMAVPPIAWAPLALIFFGVGYLAIAVVIFVSATFPMAATIEEGVQAIGSAEVRAARTLGATRWQLLHAVYVPASLPVVTTALRIGFAQAWRALVAAEMIGASRGIGWMVATGGQVGNSSQVLLGIVLIGLIAWLMESLVFRRMERHYRGWRT